MRILRKKALRLITLATIVLIATLFNLDHPTLADDLHGRVASITDGDTLNNLASSQQAIIRLAGINTPEREQP
jgi:endonuclease YncB( thermonuclease family)